MGETTQVEDEPGKAEMCAKAGTGSNQLVCFPVCRGAIILKYYWLPIMKMSLQGLNSGVLHIQARLSHVKLKLYPTDGTCIVGFRNLLSEQPSNTLGVTLAVFLPRNSWEHVEPNVSEQMSFMESGRMW